MFRQRRHGVEDFSDILEDTLGGSRLGGQHRRLAEAFQNDADYGPISKRNHDARTGNHQIIEGIRHAVSKRRAQRNRKGDFAIAGHAEALV